MRNIIVTGGAGYIGSHTAKFLSKSGFTPVTVDNLQRGFENAVKWGPFERSDIRDTATLIQIFNKYSPLAVLHFAALAYVGESITSPDIYYDNNVNGTLSLLNAMKFCHCNKLVFSSTCATYGIPIQIPIKEITPQNPINPYGQTKLICEKIINDFSQAYNIDFVILRYFNAVGADPDLEVGESHDPETHLIPLALKAALSGEPLIVFGNNYQTKDGSCIRDFIHVCDLATAHVAALKLLLREKKNNIFNLGNARGHSVFDVIKSVETITKTKLHYKIGIKRDGDPPILIADAQKARDNLGWQPIYESLDEQVEHAWKWMLHQSEFTI